ncbi:D-ribose pyranase [Streptomyces sp. H27-D2]|uniref:D-ribose pyranase n=1 Tax=Streptomyces sp. H27-D2 TaxID=3046304 RepID=UPI002DB82880|nr:D-ribose pyranase [Streptomyces sp. H27-D2]MEC4021020.1 D-ribose pyranase [Streptomyces sp. H27-D2]
MKKAGILNRHLAGALAVLGHTDTVMVCDAGLPIPDGPGGPIVVDLAFRAGVPTFAEVLAGLLDELVVEGAMAACEIRDHNPAATALLDGYFPGRSRGPDAGPADGPPHGPALELIPHEELKSLTRAARLVVRTGEAKPYANVLLRCGVPF